MGREAPGEQALERDDMAASEGTTDRPRESLVTLIPRLATFLWHLVKDPRVPWTAKAALAGLAAYLATPIDIIPDWIPGGGYLDDALLIAFVVSYVLAKVPPEVVREHWGEDVEVLERLKVGRRKGRQRP
jgi:uncharacterized membrane protein YkvA (DUF1232 family)